MSYNVSYVILKLFKTLIFMMTSFVLPFQQMISQCPQLCLLCISSHNTRTLCHLVVMEYPKKSMIRMHHKSITYLKLLPIVNHLCDTKYLKHTAKFFHVTAACPFLLWCALNIAIALGSWEQQKY